MLSLIDRYLLRTLIVHYLIGLGIMLSLYVVLDMFVNMDEFTEHGYSVPVLLGNIWSYYWPNLFLYFAQLSGALTLFACMAVLARLRRQNELTAILASGVSLFRVARPVVLFGLGTSLLLVVATEWVIPRIAHLLARDHDDVAAENTYEVLFLKDRDNWLLSAQSFNPQTRDLERLLAIQRDEDGSVVASLEADRAEWEPLHEATTEGHWKLERGREVRLISAAGEGIGPQEQKDPSFPTYYESELSPSDILLRQAEGWIRFLSLAQLNKLEEAGKADRAAVLQTRHARFTAPLLSLVLLLLGLPFFLDRSPASVLSDAGKCIIACGLCYITSFIAQALRPETVSALPAWIPIFLFGTLAVVLIDRVKT